MDTGIDGMALLKRLIVHWASFLMPSYSRVTGAFRTASGPGVGCGDLNHFGCLSGFVFGSEDKEKRDQGNRRQSKANEEGTPFWLVGFTREGLNPGFKSGSRSYSG